VIVPRHYSLSLDLRRAERTFSGRVAIDVEGGGDRIDVDCTGLTIDGATARILEQTETTLTLEGGTSHVEIAFHGAMNEHAQGLYRGDGFCVTQMQPSNARRVFPCFDDPAFKATFDVTVTSGEDVVITNGGTGAPMAAHMVLVAAGEFRISNFEFRISDAHPREFAIRNPKSEIRNSIPVRLLTLDEPHRYTYAIECARNALTFYENWLGLPYPWPQLDLIAVPTFEADGMESSGAIVFRSDAISGDASERIATLVAHELAHQWFGSLVTPASWGELWLSEGFATWMAAKATGNDAALVREIRGAMGADSARSARPMRATAADAKELFDPIAYAKGAAILRMLESHAGEEPFRRGIAEYLHRHSNGCATAADLWRVLHEVTGIDAAALASPFTDHAGVPQLHFAWSGKSMSISRRDAAARVIPLSMRVILEDGTSVLHRAVIRDDLTTLAMPSPLRSLLGNAGASGYYRSTYAHWSAVALHDASAAEKTAFLSDLYDAVWSAESDVLVLLRALESHGEDADTTALRQEISEQVTELLGRSQASPSSPAAAPDELSRTAGAQRIAMCEALLRHPATRRATWSYLKDHWTDLQDELISFGGRGAIPSLAAVSEPDLRNDIAAFFAQHPPRGAERALQHTLEQIDARIRFREREQRRYDCRAIWIDAGRPQATPQLRFAHSILNGVTSALYGSLHARLLLDQLRVTAPEWMHTAADLRNVVGGLEQRFLRLFRGEALVDHAVMELAGRAREDLNATAAMAEGAPLEILTIFASREVTAREHFLSGMIAFADLLEGEEHADRVRPALAAVERDVMTARINVVRVQRGAVDDAMRASLAAAALLLPGTFRSQAVDLAAIDAAIRGDRSFDHAAATWAAFGFTPTEAETARTAGFAHPATARLAANRR
jgi:aminopeptidase N